MSYIVDFRGHPACPCLAEWYPVHEAELQRRGILAPGQQIHIFQLIGNATASAGVHSEGGCGDDDQLSEEAVWVARQMGADACWSRTTGSFATNKHRHLVLTGCPHNGPARYQIDEVRAGGDGLIGSAPDPGPRPLSGRTWRQGIAWALEQGDDMANHTQQLNEIQFAAQKTQSAAEQAVDLLLEDRKRDRARFERGMKRLAKILAECKDDATSAELQAAVDELTGD